MINDTNECIISNFSQEEFQKYNISYSHFLIILHGQDLVYLDTPKS